MGVLYAVPWYTCNNKCPHCELAETEMVSDSQFERWLRALRRVEDMYPIILFGGEPTMNSERFRRILETENINSVSSNLMYTSPKDLKLMAEYGCDVATSWNPQRFNNVTRAKWHANLCYASEYGLDVTVLITLTKDLFEMDMKEVLAELAGMEGCGCDKFLFEHYIGEEDLNKEADEWLVKFHDAFEHSNIHMANLIEEKLKNWNCNCTKTMTLEPTGVLRKGCPQMNRPIIPMECLTCEISHKCQPCVLQKSCSYPKKLAAHLSELSD